METLCSLCKRILTDSQGNRIASGIWDTKLGIGVLCSECNGDMAWAKQAGDALLTSAITMETVEVVKGFFSAKEIKEHAELYYRLALQFYIQGFERSNLNQSRG